MYNNIRGNEDYGDADSDESQEGDEKEIDFIKKLLFLNNKQAVKQPKSWRILFVLNLHLSMGKKSQNHMKI